MMLVASMAMLVVPPLIPSPLIIAIVVVVVAMVIGVVIPVVAAPVVVLGLVVKPIAVIPTRANPHDIIPSPASIHLDLDIRHHGNTCLQSRHEKTHSHPYHTQYEPVFFHRFSFLGLRCSRRQAIKIDLCGKIIRETLGNRLELRFCFR